MPEFDRDGAKVVIVGGGAIGLSVAYHLAELGRDDVLLLERNNLTSGTSWHAAGIVGPLRASMNLTKLAIYATELFAVLEEETGQATGYRRTGGLWLAQSPDRLIELHRIAAMGQMTGLEARIIAPEDAAEKLPLLRVDDLCGALWVGEDGQVNPVDLCMAYAKGARAGGVRIREEAGVAGFETKGRRIAAVLLDDGSRVACETLVICSGVWSRQLGALAGVSIPVQAAEHIYVVTEPVPGLPQPFPILRDLEGGIYVKEDAGKLVLGGFEPNAKPWDPESVSPKASFLMFPEDWDQAEQFLTAGLHRLPLLERTGLQHFMNGPEGFTPDTRQVMGKAPERDNVFLAAGFNSIGIVSSAGVGRALAAWIAEDEAPLDLWEVDIARHEPAAASRAFLGDRLCEAVHDQFDLHWPGKQPRTGRGLKRSPLHDCFAAKGAVFGAPAGWERPLWFAETAEEAELRYSYGDQPWWPMAAREAKALQERVALFELSPFGKFAVEGPDALALLQRLCANDVNVAPGRLVYSQMLNRHGGIEADVTVTRLSEDRFWVVGGAATRRKDFTFLKRAIGPVTRVSVTDMTSAYAVLGVMGPASRDLMAAVSPDDLSRDAFPFASARSIEIGYARVLAARVSFAGELGWELTIPAEFAPHVFEHLSSAGADFGLTLAGHYCLDACRLENGFRHWGHDMGPEDTPLEAGLGFAVAWDKPGGFVGREALLKQRATGPARRLLLFKVEGHPLLLHDEPIYRAGRLIGRSTSGGRGFRTGLSLCFGTIDCAEGETRADLLADKYEISVADERFALIPLARPAYDPDGARMRG